MVAETSRRDHTTSHPGKWPIYSLLFAAGRSSALNPALTLLCHIRCRSMRSWESTRPPRRMRRGSDSQDHVDPKASLIALGW